MIGQMIIAITLAGLNDLGPLVLIDQRIPLLLALRLSVRRFQMPLEGLRFVKTLATFGNSLVYATNALLQNISQIVCLC